MRTLAKVLVTPPFCDELVRENKDRLQTLGKQPRHLDPSNLKRISRDMENDTFQYPQDTPLAFTGGKNFKFILSAAEANSAGANINGFHRITACSETRKSFLADVWIECAAETIRLFDRAKTRTFRDDVEINSNVLHCKSAGLASIVNRAARYLANGNPFSDLIVTREELTTVSEEHKDILDAAIEIASDAPFYKSVYGIVYFVAALNGYAEEARDFLVSVRDGKNLKDGSPEYKLRQKMYEKERDKITRRPQEAALLMVFALRHKVLGTSFRNFSLKSGFTFPDGVSGLVSEKSAAA